MILTNKTYRMSDMLLLSFKTTPLYSAYYAFQNVVNALIPTANIFITAWFIDKALAVVDNKAVIPDIAVPLLLLAAIMVYNVFISRILGIFDIKNAQAFRTRLSPEVIEKRARLKCHCIENRETLDLISRVAASPGDSIRSMYITVMALMQLSVSTLGVIVTIFTQVWLVGVIFIIIIFPIVYIAYRAGKATYNASRDMSEIDRKTGALSGVLLSREASEERTLFGYSSELGKRFDDAFEYSRRYRLKVDFKFYFRKKIGGIICTLLSIVTAAAMLPSVVHGELAIGMFIALIGATLNLTERFTSVNSMISDLTNKREYLRDLTEFMALPEDDGACDLPAEAPAFKTIEFRDISFKYPGTEKIILNELSFILNAGGRYSFVGVNGAGKTTIIKLLTGLYSEYEGEILIDGKPLRSLSSAQRKGLASVVYQDFARYAISLKDNIIIGDVNKLDDFDAEKRIQEIISSVHFENALSKLPNGLDTPIGKVFNNGVDLSGGEWQRVAMARAMMNRAPLCILDEPTAALDPKSESQLYERFHDISHDRTTLFISHRLGSTKFTDTIFVLDGGRIRESGNHEQLMNLNGLYAEMFRSQASWYIDDTESKPEGAEIYAL